MRWVDIAVRREHPKDKWTEVNIRCEWGRPTSGRVDAQWNRPEDVPEYMQMPDPSWAGTYCELDALEPIFASDTKIAYKIEVTRFHADGSVMQTFEAIYTVMKKDGDWRVVQRNPINIFPAVRKNSISRDHDGNEAPLH